MDQKKSLINLYCYLPQNQLFSLSRRKNELGKRDTAKVCWVGWLTCTEDEKKSTSHSHFSADQPTETAEDFQLPCTNPFFPCKALISEFSKGKVIHSRSSQNFLVILKVSKISVSYLF